ncbi:MAG: hypothetical protein PHU80_09425 [Kiritimatiellae bacterium]|nr:hypothetical protein [Kiritimatiellia bacterium]
MKTLMTMAAAALMVAATATAQCPAKGQKKTENKCDATECKAADKKAENKCDKCPCTKKASCDAAGSKKAACPKK